MTSPSNKEAIPRLAYSIAEACKATGLSSVYLHKLFNDGSLTRRKVGKRTFVLATELDAFLRSCPSTKWGHTIAKDTSVVKG